MYNFSQYCAYWWPSTTKCWVTKMKKFVSYMYTGTVMKWCCQSSVFFANIFQICISISFLMWCKMVYQFGYHYTPSTFSLSAEQDLHSNTLHFKTKGLERQNMNMTARAGVNSGIGIGIDFNSNSNSGIGIGIASHGIGIGIGIARWNWLELKRNWRFHFNSTNNCCYFMSFLQSRITNIDCLLIEIMFPLEYSTS